VTGSDARHLAGLTEEQRDEALARWQVLRPHIEDGVPLTRLAGHGGVAARTLQRWAARYRADGLARLPAASEPTVQPGGLFHGPPRPQAAQLD
jgi:putative transposase